MSIVSMKVFRQSNELTHLLQDILHKRSAEGLGGSFVDLEKVPQMCVNIVDIEVPLRQESGFQRRLHRTVVIGFFGDNPRQRRRVGLQSVRGSPFQA